MSQSATPATQNDMTTCFETFEMKGFASSPRDTRPHENQRPRHVGASKPAFRARLPQIFKLCSFKIDVFPRNGCERLPTVASEHTLNPQTPRVKWEPLLRIREKCFFSFSGKFGKMCSEEPCGNLVSTASLDFSDIWDDVDSQPPENFGTIKSHPPTSARALGNRAGIENTPPNMRYLGGMIL